MTTSKNPAVYARRLLKFVVKNFAYFEAYPPQLAWAMMHYDALLRQARIHFKDWTNPKDDILAVTALSPAQANLLYDAWAITVSNYDKYNDPASNPKQAKIYKTMGDWLDLTLDPEYQYHSLYPTKKQTYNTVLCVIGTGMNWVEHNGISYIAEVGPSGINNALFAGYTKAQRLVAPKIKTTILAYADRYGTIDAIKRGISNGKKIAKGWQWEINKDGQSRKLVPPSQDKLSQLLNDPAHIEQLKKLGIKVATETSEEEDTRQYYPLCAYSNLVRMPKTAHPSYIHAGVRVAAEILHNPQESKSNKTEARKFLRRTKTFTACHVNYHRWTIAQLLASFSKTPEELPTAPKAISKKAESQPPPI